MSMYSLNGNIPEVLPESIRMPDGLTRTDSKTFTDEEIALAGYVLADPKPIIDERVQKVRWNYDSWLVEDLSEAELEQLKRDQWATIRETRNKTLSHTDWMVIKAFETQTPLPDDFLLYRQGLRDITNQTDPFNIIWPNYPSVKVEEQSNESSQSSQMAADSSQT